MNEPKCVCTSTTGITMPPICSIHGLDFSQRLQAEITRLRAGNESLHDLAEYVAKCDTALDEAKVPDSLPKDEKSSLCLLSDDRVRWLAKDRDDWKRKAEEAQAWKTTTTEGLTE